MGLNQLVAANHHDISSEKVGQTNGWRLAVREDWELGRIEGERVWLDSGIKGALQGCNMDNEEWRDGLGSKRKGSRGSDEFLDGRMTGNKSRTKPVPEPTRCGE